MITIRMFGAAFAATVALSSAPSFAQSETTTQSTQSQENRVGTILRSLFGGQLGGATSLEQQWALGRKPLAAQRTQFHTRIDADVRSRALTEANGTRMKGEYDRLVALEERYGADGRFTTQERTELADGYGALTQALSEGGFGDSRGSSRLAVAEGRAEFEKRVDAAVAARRLTRTEATRLKRDYADLIQVEAGYARTGITSRQQDDLDARLDALDARVGDAPVGGSSPPVTPKTRLAAIERALTGSGLTATVQAQIRVEHGDLTRLEAAYARAAPSSEDRAYLDRRLTDLETRARVRR